MPIHDIAAGRIAIVGGAIAATVAAVVIAVFLLLNAWGMPAPTDRVRLPPPSSVETPALQSAPQLDLAQYRAEKQRVLESGAWVDAKRGIARIPIATAMDLLAQQAAAPGSKADGQP